MQDFPITEQELEFEVFNHYHLTQGSRYLSGLSFLVSKNEHSSGS